MEQPSLFGENEGNKERGTSVEPASKNVWRILHTADWHLGKRLGRADRTPEQKEVLQEIEEIADRENVDAIVVAGDLFDTFNPPAGSVDLFYRALKDMARDGERPVICIAGNHDSPDRIEAPDPIAKECGILFSGYPNTRIPPFELPSGMKVTRSEEGFLELELPHKSIPLRLLLAPYANAVRLRTFLGEEDSEKELRRILSEYWNRIAEDHLDEKGANIMVGHLFMIGKDGTEPEEPDSEKPILHVGGAQAIYTSDLPDGLQYVAMGHLHRRIEMAMDPVPVVYSGSPLTYDFGGAGSKNSVTIVDIPENGNASTKVVELNKGKPLWRARFNNVEEAIKGLKENPDAWVELTVGTEEFLTAEDRKRLGEAHEGIISLIPEIKNERLLDKKDQQVDLDKSREELFKDFFLHYHGEPPNENIMELFKEVVARAGNENA